MNSKLIFLYLAAFVTISGFGMVFPLLPFYAQTFGATNTQIGLLAASFSIAQFLSAPIVGRISDRFGRKPVLAVSLLGSAVAFLIFGLAPSLSWLFFSRVLHGIFSTGAFPIAAAYIGDIVSKEERIKYMARLTATFSLGFIVGPAVSGLLSGYSMKLPFFLASFVAAMNSFFILIFLQESLTKKAERLVIKEGLMNVKAIISGLRSDFGVLFFLLFSWAFAISNFQVALPLFSEDKFSFTGVQNGLIFSFSGTVAAIVQWIILPKFTKKVGELPTIALGAIGMALGQFLISLSPTVGFLLIFVSLSTFGSALLRPTANAILSKETTEGQGTTMGLAFSFESLGRVVGPLSAGFLIAAFNPQIQFVLTSFILFSAVLFFLAKNSWITQPLTRHFKRLQ